MFGEKKQAMGSCSYLRVSNIRFCSFTTFFVFVLEMEAAIKLQSLSSAVMIVNDQQDKT